MNDTYQAALDRAKVIVRLTDETMDPAQRAVLRKAISAETGHSERTLFRWEKAFREHGLDGLVPRPKGHGQGKKLVENFAELLEHAKEMKREEPTRSVRKIIRVLEIEGKVKKNDLKRSTLSKHLRMAGCSTKQLTMSKENREEAARRYVKDHRMVMVQCDIKYSHVIRECVDGKIVEKTLYLSSILDDRSRFLLHSMWYPHQRGTAVEASYKMAILKYGKFDVTYSDNGSQYIMPHLKEALQTLGIKVLHAPPKSGKSKGKVEKFHRVVDSFLAEAKLEKVTTVEEFNKKWEEYLYTFYTTMPHEGIASTNYVLKGVEAPKGGITPEQEWQKDTRQLSYPKPELVIQAFLHRQERKVDKGALISVLGHPYAVNPEWRTFTVGVEYDPVDMSTITVIGPDGTKMKAKLATIGEYIGDYDKKDKKGTEDKADKEGSAPSEQPQKKKNSRILQAAADEYEKAHQLLSDAISFTDYLPQETMEKAKEPVNSAPPGENETTAKE